MQDAENQPKKLSFSAISREFSAARRLAMEAGLPASQARESARQRLIEQLGVDIRALFHVDAFTPEEPPPVARFWEIFDHLNDRCGQRPGWLNHSTDEGLIAVNLNEIRDACRKYNQINLDIRQLKKLLPESRGRRLKEKGRSIWLADSKKSIRCWVFAR